MTNMRNSQTCTICYVNLILATIAVMHGEAVQVIGEVVGGARVKIPVVVGDTMGDHVARAVTIALIDMVEAVATLESFMAKLLVDLALGAIAAVAATSLAAVLTRGATLAAATTATPTGGLATVVAVHVEALVRVTSDGVR